jgi:membrane protein DedA with SNARE-associated domain
VAGFFEWLASVPLAGLYALVFGASFIEGIVPPVPGDVAAAFLAFLAARAGGALLATTLCVTGGSVAGSAVVWWLGRKYGADWMAREMVRFHLSKDVETAERAEHRIEAAYRRYGLLALFVSRFVPGVRAMAPAAAGALRVPLPRTLAVFAVASFLWYGAITWLAFTIGNDWPAVREAIGRLSRDVGAGAIVAALVLVLIGWRLWKRRRAR